MAAPSFQETQAMASQTADVPVTGVLTTHLEPVDAPASMSVASLTPSTPLTPDYDDVGQWLRTALSPPVEPAVEPSAALIAEQMRRAMLLNPSASKGVSPGDRLTRPLPEARVPGADAAGAWTAPQQWPLIAIHAALLPDGRVMTYGTSADGQQTGKFIYDLWDSASPSQDTGHLTLPNMTRTDLFCNAQTLLPGTGELFLAGGDNFVGGKTTNTGNNNSALFDPASNTLRPGDNLHRPRWYASVATLADGQIFIMGGGGGNDRPEVRGSNGAFTLLDDIDTDGFNYWYPRLFLAADGRIFGFDVRGRMFHVDPHRGGTLQRHAKLHRDFVGEGSSAVMYAPGQILQVGGNSNRVARIAIDHPQPQVEETAPLSTRRYWNTATVLPDGKVLVTGGSSLNNRLSGVDNAAEFWDPATGRWTRGASGALARLYHSTALLLPDASVLVAGGGAPGPLRNTNAERYMPPYLFGAGGRIAPRPRISASPDNVLPGQTIAIAVQSKAPIGEVALVRTGSVTHSFNFDQRRVVLPHTAVGSTLMAQLPDSATAVPPGYYMLFVLDARGVPSVARILRVEPSMAAHTARIGVN